MPLHFDLMVNSEEIGRFSAVRVNTEGNLGRRPDDVNFYLITIDSPGEHQSFVVDHRYGDGAWGLIRAAMEQLAWPDPSPTPGAFTEGDG